MSNMSSSALPQAMSTPLAQSSAGQALPALGRLHTMAIVIAAVALSILTLYGVFAGQATVMHEFAHDARHLFGAPCH